MEERSLSSQFLSQPNPLACESFQDRDLILHSLLCLQHLVFAKDWTVLNEWINELVN